MLVLLDSGAHSATPPTVLSPFFRDIGTAQGRIQVAGAPDGQWVYELGHATREDGFFNVGDYHEVSQVVLVAGPPVTSLYRVDVDVLLPLALPTGPALEWEFTARFKGVPFYARRLRVEQRSLTLRDVAVSLATTSPPDTLAFRLELVTA